MDVDIRLLRYFVAVAEEGNLTHAARRLFVSQPALTKQIKQLEQLLGVALFTRSKSGMTLTEAGQAFAASVPGVLADWDRTVRHTRNAASRRQRVLRVGYLASAANEATQRIIAEFADRRPDWRADMRQSSWSDPTAGLSGGEVDVALVRLPFPGQDDFRLEVLSVEDRWAVLPATHPLADRDQIAFRELWDETFVAAPAETGAWRDYWLAAEDRDDRPIRIGAVVDQPDDWLSAIANGYGIALAPESAARFYARPGIVYRPVDGVAPSRIAVAWAPEDDDDPVIGDFVGCCVANRPDDRDSDGTDPGPESR